MKKSYHSMAVPKQLANTTFLYPSCPPDRAATCGSWRRAVVGCISPLNVGTTREANPERTSERLAAPCRLVHPWCVIHCDPSVSPLFLLSFRSGCALFQHLSRNARYRNVHHGAAAAAYRLKRALQRLVQVLAAGHVERVGAARG